MQQAVKTVKTASQARLPCSNVKLKLTITGASCHLDEESWNLGHKSTVSSSKTTYSKKSFWERLDSAAAQNHVNVCVFGLKKRSFFVVIILIQNCKVIPFLRRNDDGQLSHKFPIIMSEVLLSHSTPEFPYFFWLYQKSTPGSYRSASSPRCYASLKEFRGSQERKRIFSHPMMIYLLRLFRRSTSLSMQDCSLLKFNPNGQLQVSTQVAPNSPCKNTPRSPTSEAWTWNRYLSLGF